MVGSGRKRMVRGLGVGRAGSVWRVKRERSSGERVEFANYARSL